MKRQHILVFALLAQTSLSQTAYAVDASALPNGGQVAGGSADITQSGAHMDIHQHSDKAIINWQGFDVGRDAHVRFHQNSGNAVALNRVIAGDASQIHGRISANGHVYLINPSGVVFGNSARVDVGGLVASTHDMDDDDFIAGKRIFHRNGATGKIVNNGTITATDGGDVVLIGAEVSNQGRITANGGNIVLAAGEKVTLNAGANGYLQVAVDGATLDTLVANGGVLQADGGQIVMNAEAASAAYASVVSNTGTVQARTLQHKKGRILLLADMEHGETKVAGKLDASAPDGGDGGFIETSAAKVKVASSTQVTTKAADGKTGMWLVDPIDITIAATGGDMTGTQLSEYLENSNMVLDTTGPGAGNGDIFIRDEVSWAADNTLTLTAVNDIFIEKDISISGAGAGLILNYGGDYHLNDGASVTLSGTNPYLEIGGQQYQVINDVAGLNGMVSGGFYAIGSNIDASSTNDAGLGFNPRTLGTGQFHGLGHTIDALYINRPGMSWVGLFGDTSTGHESVIRDIGLTNVDITGNDYVGGITGLNYGLVSGAYVTGVVRGNDKVGGLVGQNSDADIQKSFATSEVNGVDDVGGLVGNNSGYIEIAYATGEVNGNDNVGGLVGLNEVLRTISDAFSTGTVTGNDNVGGLAGGNSGTITDAFSTGEVSGNVDVGGLVGALIVSAFSSITDSFWNTEVYPASAGGAGRTSAEMQSISTYTSGGWDISSQLDDTTVWYISEGLAAPQLRYFGNLTPPSSGGGGGSSGGDVLTDSSADGGALSLTLQTPGNNSKQNGASVTMNGQADEEKGLLGSLLTLTKNFIAI